MLHELVQCFLYFIKYYQDKYVRQFKFKNKLLPGIEIEYEQNVPTPRSSICLENFGLF